MSDLPSIVAAEAILRFRRPAKPKQIEAFFSDLAIRLFRIGSVRGQLLGHIKIFAHGEGGGTARVNITGTIKNKSVDVNATHEEKEFKIWINVITYGVTEQELERRFMSTLEKAYPSAQAELVDLKLIKHEH